MPPLSEPAPSAKSSLRRLWPLLLVAGLAALALALGWHRYLTLEELAARRDELRLVLERHLLLTILAYVAIYIATVALSLPGGAVLTLAGGFLFGWFWGGTAALIGATIGAVCVYAITRTALKDMLAATLDTPLERFRRGFSENAFSYLLFLRLVPVFPFWLVNLVPGPLGVRFGTYLAATAIGIVPGTFAYSIAGAGLDSVIAAQSAHCAAMAAEPCPPIDASALLTPELIAGLVALGLVSLLPVLVKLMRKAPY